MTNSQCGRLIEIEVTRDATVSQAVQGLGRDVKTGVPGHVPGAKNAKALRKVAEGGNVLGTRDACIGVCNFDKFIEFLSGTPNHDIEAVEEPCGIDIFFNIGFEGVVKFSSIDGYFTLDQVARHNPINLQWNIEVTRLW